MRTSALLALLLTTATLGCRSALPAAPMLPSEDAEFSRPEQAEPPGLAEDEASPFVLLPGDVVSIRIVSIETTETPGLVIDEVGSVDVPLVGSVTVGGLPPSVAQQLVQAAVRALDRFARVVVTATDAAGHRAIVAGAVEHPGVVPVRAGARIAELLALGGGPKTKDFDGQSIDLADLAAGRVVRRGTALPVSLARAMEGDPRHNVRVRAGDILFVPAARGRDVSVLGDVHAAKVVPFVPGMRLSKALAMAGGPTREADEADIRIIRGSLSAPRVFRASLRALVQGNGSDVVLRAGDVIYVSEHWFASSMEVVQRITPLLVGAAFVASFR